MCLATSLMIHQSALATPGLGNKRRCLEMRLSEFVTVPDFSLQPCAGNNTSAYWVVAVSAIQSETITVGHFFNAAIILLLLGKLTTGLVAMIQTAFILPLFIASNKSTAFNPGLVASCSVSQNSLIS